MDTNFFSNVMLTKFAYEGLKKAKGQFIILMDADLSHHPKYIP